MAALPSPPSCAIAQPAPPCGRSSCCFPLGHSLFFFWTDGSGFSSWLSERGKCRDGFVGEAESFSLFLSFSTKMASKLVHHGAHPDTVQKGSCLPSPRTVPIPPSCSLYILPLSFATSQCV
jgi:hypothetical protein